MRFWSRQRYAPYRLAPVTGHEHAHGEHDAKEAKAGDEHIPEGEVIYRAIRPREDSGDSCHTARRRR